MSNSAKISLPKAIISEFRIDGLYGEKSVFVKFNKGVKILVAENGSGKTTLLNTLYSVLEGNFHKLGWLPFSQITLTFTSGEIVQFDKSDMPDPMEWSKSGNPFIEDITRAMGNQAFRELALVVERSTDEPEYTENLSPSLRRLIFESTYTPLSTYRKLREIREEFHSKHPKSVSKNREKLKSIKKQFPFNTIYMPTYRRVEEDIRSLGLSSQMRHERPSGMRDRHIFFGMADVNETFDRVTTEIRQSTAKTFRLVSSKVIDELLERGISATSEIDISRLKDQNAIGLVLKRLGKELPLQRLAQLNNFIKKPNEVDSDGKMLLYLLNNFFEIYETQFVNDQKIKSFIAVVNKYLVNKEFKYDEVNISIDVFSQRTGKPLDLAKLSSGEKQLVSILSRLYLSSDENYAIIIDEPELSLSIEWQKSLLPDMLRSGKCKFLLAATHSPFIFENELEKYTSTLMTEIKL